MRNYILIFVNTILIIFNYNMKAQTSFFKSIDLGGYERGITVEELNSGDFIVTGYTNAQGAGGEDVLLLKTNYLGEILWTKTYGGSGDEHGWAVRQLNDEGFIIVGYTDSFGSGGNDVYLIRTDANGDELWTKFFGGSFDEYGWDIRITSDGGFIIAAETVSVGNGKIDAYLIKTDSEGNEEWNNFFGGDQDDRVFSVQQTQDGGYITTGITYSFESINSGDRDGYIVKTNSNGDLEWYKVFGGNGYDVGHSIALTNDGGFIITGYGISFSTNGSREVYLIKYNEIGQEIWKNVYGDVFEERGIKGLQTQDGGYVVIGINYQFSDLYIIKTDIDGNLSWSKTFGESNKFEFGYTVQQTMDGGYILTGWQENLNHTMSDVLLIKINSDGLLKSESEETNSNQQ